MFSFSLFFLKKRSKFIANIYVLALYDTKSYNYNTLYPDIIPYDKSTYDGTSNNTNEHLFSGGGTSRGAPMEQFEAYPSTSQSPHGQAAAPQVRLPEYYAWGQRWCRNTRIRSR